MGNLNIKRIYEEPLKTDGIRIFVDRLWARGVTKERAHLYYWFKNIAPSTSLRKWFNHEPEKFEDFKQKYYKELNCNLAEIQEILNFLKNNNVTLIYAAKNTEINHAIVLKTFIEECYKSQKGNKISNKKDP